MLECLAPIPFVTQPIRSRTQSMPITALRPTLLGAITPALALLLGLATPGVHALGLGRPQVQSTLGRPLDVTFPLLLAEGEQLADGCARAEVIAGDARVPAGLLQLRLEGEPGQRRVRLTSQVGIDEPALRITLALGCPLVLTREFNAFIDPPGGASQASAAAPPPAPVYAPPPLVETARLEVQPPAPKPRPRPKPRVTGPRLTLEQPEILASAAARPARPAASAVTELTPELEAQITQLEQTVAQLRAEILARQQAEGGAASAPEAAVPASAAASPPEAAPASAAPAPEAFRVAPTLAPAPRPSPYRDPMTWLLTLAMSLIAGAGAFYFSRWRDQRARQELAYWRALHAAEGAGLPRAVPAAPAAASGVAAPVLAGAMVGAEDSPHQITRPQPRPMPWPPTPAAPTAPQAAVIPTSMQATQPLPVRASAEPVVTSAPTGLDTLADELLDLQQQVEFLLLLGQQDAAADLLASRLTRGPTGVQTGAMPHLMLMELCQQRGDPEAFAELVTQFQQRFGSLGPDWSQSLSRGRTLDASPSVMAHLQVVWSDSAAAMRMLQELLAHGRGPGVTQFDLPAYRDLLLLYSVARDLYEAGLRGDEVDLMLPLDSRFDG